MISKVRAEFFENSNDLLCVVDSDGHFVDLNPRWEKVLGWSVGELIHRPYSEFLHPEDQDASKAMAHQMMMDGKPIISFMNRYRTKDGTYRWLQWSGSRMSQAPFLICSARDVTEEREQQLLLKMQNERLELTQRIAKFGTWEFDLATGKIFWSKEIFEIHGLVGRTEPPAYEELLTYFTEQSREKLIRAVNDAIQNGTPYNFRCDLVLQNGAGIRPAFASGLAIKDSNNKVFKIHGTLADLTDSISKERELLKKDKELIETKNQTENLVQFVPVGIFQADQQGQCVFVNKAWSNMTGLALEEAIGDGWVKALHPQDLPSVRENWLRTLSENQEFKMNYRFLNREGKEIFVHGMAKPLFNTDSKISGYIGAAIDITLLKDYEANNALYRTALDRAAIVAFTDRQGRITYANEKFCEISGYSESELLGQDHRLLNSGFHPKSFFTELWRQISQGKTWQGEICNRNKNGSLYWVATTIVPILGAKGAPERFIAIRHEITNEKENQKKAIHNGKMSSLGEMSSGIAHEINNPLTIINGRASNLLAQIQRGELNEKRIKDGLEAITSTALRISKIVRSLKSFSRNAENDPFHDESLSQIIDDTLELCRERFRFKSIDLIIESFEDVKISCRPSEISQVLLNLLNNAFDAVVDSKNPWVKISVQKNDKQLVIAVTDSGTGIPQSLQDKILEPFFTTKEVGKGTGLGLSISKGILESHGGSLRYNGQIANTQFEITLPIAG